MKLYGWARIRMNENMDEIEEIDGMLKQYLKNKL